jgi:hypothetical protein
MMGEGKKKSDAGGLFERVLNGDPRLWKGVRLVTSLHYGKSECKHYAVGKYFARFLSITNCK